MCGIAGFFGRGSLSLAQEMEKGIRQRGPDGGDIFADPEAGIWLVHRRLAIQDLSDAGKQPMEDASGRYVLCYNGEIYNHYGLRSRIEAEGHVFRGHSDSETLIEAWARWGVEILPELNGIFAFAVWDRQMRSLTLVRDGMGVKPLYWARTPEGVGFASEMKALMALPGVDRTPDPIAARAYLSYLWSPGERTLFEGIRKLLAGQWRTIQSNGAETGGVFYRLPAYRPQEGLDDQTAIRETRDQVARAVERQMLADVEVGAFLSGGLDSTTLVHFAREYGAGRMQCFTIGYKERPDEASGFVADLPYARLAAEHLGVDLHEIEVTANMADDLERLVDILDEPQADPAALNNLYISALARSQGMKVLLSGAGGDDVFTGYRRHQAAMAHRLFGLVPAAGRDGLARLAGQLQGHGAATRRIRKAAEIMRGSPDEQLMRSFEWLPLDRTDTMFRQSEPDAVKQVRQPMQDLLDVSRGDPAVERLLRLDQAFFLTDHNLNYTDKTGMAEGVEIRVPFLDPELMQFAATLPTRVKIRGGQTKWVLRKAMEGLLPHNVIYRPKSGFGVPLAAWLRNELRERLESLTSREVIEARGLFDADAVARMRSDTLSGRFDATYPLLAVMMIELWFRRFDDPYRV